VQRRVCLGAHSTKTRQLRVGEVPPESPRLLVNVQNMGEQRHELILCHLISFWMPHVCGQVYGWVQVRILDVKNVLP